jgi:hypothetical protein
MKSSSIRTFSAIGVLVLGSVGLSVWLESQESEASEAVEGISQSAGVSSIAVAQAATSEAFDKTLTAFAGSLGDIDFEEARWHPIHFKPAIDEAADAQCLVCHAEILERDVVPVSPAGARAEEALAWYQTLDTYDGEQQTFHQRHISSPFARQVMDLSCNFCHQGNDPREEAPAAEGAQQASFTLRKTIDPSETCLRCHGVYPWEVMDTGPWREVRTDFEDEETANGCLICHGDLVRTVRHQVTYLRADAIEELAQTSSDVCFGCHGGRAWYRISYPYPRNPWPDMDEEVPEWAIGRPTESDPTYQIEAD